MNLDLTVIVPCYGRQELTKGLLDSFAASADPFNVIIVDDGSPAPLDGLVAGYRTRLHVEYVRLNSNRGPARARNIGVQRATTGLVAFTDNDCVVHPHWAGQLVTSIRRASPLVVGIGGRVLPVANDLFSRYYTYHKILDPLLLGGRYLYVVTANCVFRKVAIEAVGGFDEEITHAGGEDPGLCFKLAERGLRFEYQPDAIVWHHYRSGLRDFVRTFFRYGKGCRLQAEKYGRRIAADRAGEEIPGLGSLALGYAADYVACSAL